MAAVRLNDVHPDGAVTRVCYAPFNLCHRDGHAEPQPLEPGRRYRVRIPLKHVGQRFAAGHRLRVSVSTCYWPLAWPAPEPVTLTLIAGASVLDLPERAPRPEDAQVSFEPAVGAEVPEQAEERTPEAGWTLHEDLAAGTATVHVVDDPGRHRQTAQGLTIDARGEEWYSHDGNDPGSARGHTRWHFGFARGAWSVRTHTETLLTCDRDNFYMDAELVAWEDEREVFRETWRRTIPRKLV
jgi:hypothetical protein